MKNVLLAVTEAKLCVRLLKDYQGHVSAQLQGELVPGEVLPRDPERRPLVLRLRRRMTDAQYLINRLRAGVKGAE